MAKNFFILWAVTVLSISLAYAAGENTRMRIAPDPPELFRDPVTGMEMVHIKGGCYQMGATDDDCDANRAERPMHEVCVNDFYLAKYEVTQGQWKSIMGSNTVASSTCKENNCPVDNVSWSEVQEFIEKLNDRVRGNEYRLPTEAEWEYAARSRGKDDKFSGGGDVDSLAWYHKNSGKINHPVGTKAPNELGIYDMSGNVWEMTSDWYSEDYYSVSPRDNPKGPVRGNDHVIRGGCRTGGITNQRTTRRTFINDRTKGNGRGGNVGFRLLRGL